MTNPSFDNLLAEADTAARSSEWQDAHDKLVEASKIQPDHSGVLTGIGTCLIHLGQVEQSFPYFQKVVEIEPKSAEAQNNLGVAAILNNDPGKAETAYKAALEIAPDYRPAWKNLAGLYLQQDANVGDGVQILASLVQSDPSDVESLMLLGECYEIAGDLESGRVLFVKVLELQPENEMARKAADRVEQKTQNASRIARPEHVQKLAALKNLKKKSES
jgi:protein O-GlcNAc transferase